MSLPAPQLERLHMLSLVCGVTPFYAMLERTYFGTRKLDSVLGRATILARLTVAPGLAIGG
ncbi:hypothetical protein QF001_008061 [Paraburkholderia youngii]